MRAELSMTSAGAAAWSPAIRSETEELSFRSSLLLAAMICLSIAHRHADWRATPSAFALAALALMPLMAATILRSAGPLDPLLERAVLPALVGITAYSFYNLWLVAPADTEYSPWLLVAASLVSVGLMRNPAIERWRIPIFLSVYLWLGISRIAIKPTLHAAVPLRL